MITSEIRNDPHVIELFEMMQYSKATEHNYVSALRCYTDYMNKSPSDLIDDAKGEIKTGRMLSERSVKRHLLGFRKHMTDSGLAPQSIKSWMSNVASFYRFFDVEIPKIPRVNNRPLPIEDNEKTPTHDDLRTVLKVCDPLERALILVGCSSGMSQNEIRRLTIKQFKDGYDPDTGITIISMRRGKSGVGFTSFFSPEASEAVWDYLKYRGRPYHSNHPLIVEMLDKQRVHSDDGFLFIKSRVPREYMTTKNEKLRQMTQQSMVRLYQRLSAKAGFQKIDGVFNVIRSHNMRKVFNSSLLNDGADSFFVEYAMGHTLDKTRSTYFRPDPNRLAELYIKHIGAITIAENINVESSPEFREIKKENEQLYADKGRSALYQDSLARRVEFLEKFLSLAMDTDPKYLKAAELIQSSEHSPSNSSIRK